jgi:hypothetical protein
VVVVGFADSIVIIMFIGLLLINLGFDEISNPRLRKARNRGKII